MFVTGGAGWVFALLPHCDSSLGEYPFFCHPRPDPRPAHSLNRPPFPPSIFDRPVQSIGGPGVRAEAGPAEAGPGNEKKTPRPRPLREAGNWARRFRGRS